MLLLIVSVPTAPPARVPTGPTIERSIERLMIFASIHSRVGTKGRPSAASPKGEDGGDRPAVGAAGPAEPGSRVQHEMVTLSNSPASTRSPPLTMRPSRVSLLVAPPVNFQEAGGLRRMSGRFCSPARTVSAAPTATSDGDTYVNESSSVNVPAPGTACVPVSGPPPTTGLSDGDSTATAVPRRSYGPAPMSDENP